MLETISPAGTVARFLVECALCSFRSGEAETPEDAIALGLEHLATDHPKLDQLVAVASLRLWTFYKPQTLAEIAEEPELEADEPPPPQQPKQRAEPPKRETPSTPQQPPIRKKQRHTR